MLHSTAARLMLLLVMLLGPALGGCGYTTKEVFPKQYQTVAVPMFENRTFYRGIEFDLSEALVKQIESRTPYKVAPPNVADTMLAGSITNIEQDRISRTFTGNVPQEMEVRVTVNFEWKDLDRAQTIRSRAGFEAVGRYLPTRPISEPFEIAQREAVQTLAQDIVSTMQGEWGRVAAQDQSSEAERAPSEETTVAPADAGDRPPATQPQTAPAPGPMP
jgi:hypothetical protein